MLAGERGKGLGLRFVGLGVAGLFCAIGLGICVLRADASGGLFGSVGEFGEWGALSVLSVRVFYGLVPFCQQLLNGVVGMMDGKEIIESLRSLEFTRQWAIGVRC